jgi:hypothetical protein
VLQVHYDCKYKGVVAVSSREARLLGARAPPDGLWTS